MKIIPPYQISSEIVNIIHQAKDYLILVSPFWDINKWESIKSELIYAQKRGVKIKTYVRMNSDNYKSWEQLEGIGIKPNLVKNLHAKLYFNENKGIVTSMNLLLSSNLSSIEFGALYDSENELNELKSFVKSYITPNIAKHLPSDDDLYLSKEKFIIILINELQHLLNRAVSCRWDSNAFLLNAGNQFYFNIDKVKNNFYISGIISGIEHDNYNYFKKNTDVNKIATLNLQSSAIIATLNKKLSTSHFDNLMIDEKKDILKCIINFVLDILSYKDYCYKNRKLLQNNN